MFLINHSCKWIGNVNFHTIFNSTNATDKWPDHKDEKFSKPMIIFSYTKKSSPLFSSIIAKHWKIWISTIGVKPPTLKPVPASNSPFKDPHHGHIVSGNMDIIDDVDVKKLLKMGTAFRPPKRRNKKECIDNWTQSIDQYITKILYEKTDNMQWRFCRNGSQLLPKYLRNVSILSQDIFIRHFFYYY